MVCLKLILMFLIIQITSIQAQSQNPTIFAEEPAVWITHPDVPGEDFGVFHFRRHFELPSLPEQFIVHVSADNRYRLFVNGQQVSSGPQRSDLLHWRYETIDLAPHLLAGKNVLAAVVWNWGPQRPVAQHSHRTAFLVQGHSRPETIVNTGPTWKVLHNTAYKALPVSFDQAGGYYASPPGESVDGSLYPWGWQQTDYSDRHWRSPAADKGIIGNAELRGSHPNGRAAGWQLIARTIPPMEETVVRLQTVRRSEGVQKESSFLSGNSDFEIPAHTQAVLLLDNAHLTNAYMVLETSHGNGSKVKLTYAEALKDADGRKGNRDEIEGKTISGVEDIIYFDGGLHRRFRTLWFRTYRYIQLEIETVDEPLIIHDLHGIFTAYPYQMNAQFSSNLKWLNDMWEINWRVTRLCAWETFFDTPYYEQLQYVGDTRIQALVSLYMSGDDRLVRQAIDHFNYSRIAEGLTSSRYPSELRQIIPTFSLIWIAMVHDYWMHRDDTVYVRKLIPAIRGVLAWFEDCIDETGLLGPITWWPFVDWADGWPRGNPPGALDGHSVMITLQFVYALQRAIELEQALGQPAEAERYRLLASKLLEAAATRTWDRGKKLYRDALELNKYSQQTNTMALLVGAIPDADRKAFITRVLTDSLLTQATYYYSYYVFEALREAGLADQYIEKLTPWQQMLELGLTTTPEKPEPTRSDSHAWAAHPNYGLLATVLGVRPLEPGFRSVRIAPSLGLLQNAAGSVPHPRGNIDVRIVRTDQTGIKAEVSLPQGLEGVFEWHDEQIELRAGRQEIVFN